MACAVSGLCRWSEAQTWLPGADGVWSNALNWSGPLVSSGTTDLVFPASGTQTYVATNDLVGPFLVHGMSFTGSSTGAITVESGSLSTIHFAGASPFINNTAFGPVFLSGRASFRSNTSINVGDTAPSPTTLAATLLGGGALIINNAGGSPVVLASGNTFGGGVTLNAGRLELGTQSSLGPSSMSANGGVLSTSLAVTPTGNPPLRPIFANAIISSGAGLTIGGVNGYSLSGSIVGTGGVTLGPSNDLNATWTLSGNNSFSGPLNVNGSPTPLVTSTLVISSAASLGSPSVINVNGAGARLAFVAGNTPVTINTPMALGSSGGTIGAQSITTDAQVTYAGNISGTGGLTRAFDGLMTLSGNNTFSGPLTLRAGTTIVSTDSNLGGGASSLVLAGGSLALNPGFGASARSISITESGSTIHALGDATFSGVISNLIPQTYTKSGTGNLTLTGSNTYTGATIVNGGRLTAAGPLGRFNNGAATITVNSGATLTIDNTAAVPARLNSGSTISLQAGSVRLIGNGALNSIVTAGQLVAGSASQSGAGLDVISAAPAPGANARITFASLNRAGNNGSMLLFSGPGLGANTTASNTAGATNITLGAPALTNGILPFAIADATGGAGTDFATYLAANGVQPLSIYSPDLLGGATSNAAVNTATSNASVINSLKLLGGTVDATTTLQITSGAILATGVGSISGGTVTIGTAATSTTTAPTANFFTIADLTVSSRIVNFTPGVGQASGIAKMGAGVLTLAGTQNYSGPTRVLGGTLRLANAGAIPNLTEVFVAPGATFDTQGFTTTIGNINQTESVDTFGNLPHGTVSIGAGSLTLGGDNLSTAINLNVTGSGTFSKTGTGSLTVIGNQAFTGTININNGALALDTHLTDGTGMRNASRINLGTNIVSGEVVLAFDFGLKDGFNVPIVAAPQTGRTATLRFVPGPVGTPGVNFASPIQINTAAFNGLIVDSAGGTTLSGVISGTGPLTTVTSFTSLVNGPDSFALNITGSNTYTGATTLTAISTLWGNANAFGNVATAIGLGGTNGPDNPELSSSVGGLTLTRNITVNNSLNAVAQFAIIGSHAPAGSATTTYSGSISIAGSRNRLVLYSRYAPVAFSGLISSAVPEGNLPIGDTLGPGMEWTNSSVTLSGANTYAGGTRVVCGLLNFGSNTALSGPTILSGPVGTGSLIIGMPGTIGASAEPTLAASGGARTVANPMTVESNFSIGGSNGLNLAGAINLGSVPRFISVTGAGGATFSGPVSGAAGSALIKEGPGVLVLSGPLAYPGPTVAAGGILSFNASYTLPASLHVAGGGTANITANGSMVLAVPALSVDAINNSRFDITDNNAIIDFTGASPIAQIGALVASGYAAGAWTGPGIMSSLAALDSVHAVGFGDAAALGIINFAGVPVDGEAVLLRYTRYGDANLDRAVNLQDFNRLAAHFGMSGVFWHQADFNFDNIVNLQDFNRLAANFGLSASSEGPTPEDWSALAALVPEPGVSVVLPLAAFALARRRRSQPSPRAAITPASGSSSVLRRCEADSSGPTRSIEGGSL